MLKQVLAFILLSTLGLGGPVLAQTITMSFGSKTDNFCSADGGQPDPVNCTLVNPPSSVNWRWGVTGPGLNGGVMNAINVNTLQGQKSVTPINVNLNNNISTTASAMEGTHVLVAYPCTQAGVYAGGTALATYTFTVVPSGGLYYNSLQGPGINGITTQGTFYITGNQQYPPTSTSSPAIIHNGISVPGPNNKPLSCGGTYTVTGSSNGHLTVAPALWTPLNEKVSMSGQFSYSNCQPNTGTSPQADRMPHITYAGGLSGNIICDGGGSGVLEVNVESKGRFTMNPDRPYENLQDDRCLRGFNYQWYRNGVAIFNEKARQYTPIQVGTYTCEVKQYRQMWNGSAWQWDQTPEAIETSNQNTLVAPATNIVANFLFNNTAVNGSTFLNFYRCTNNVQMIVNNTSTGAAYKFKLDVVKADGTPGGPFYIYSSGWITGTPPANVDLRNTYATIPTFGPGGLGNSDVFPTGVTGKWKIIWTLDNGCGTLSVKEGLIDVLYPTTYVELQTNTSCSTCTPSAVQYYPSSNTPVAPNRVGRYSTVFLFNNGQFNNSYSCSYSYGLEKYNAGTQTWTQVGVSPPAFSTNCSTAVSHSVNISVVAGNTAPFINYFSDPTNAPDGSIWRVRVDMINPCGTNSRYAVFEIEDQNGYFRTTGPDATGLDVSTNAVEPEIRFAPVPFGDEVSAIIHTPMGGQCNLQIIAADGRLVHTLDERLIDAGQMVVPIQTSGWAPGLYLYRGNLGGRPVSGKISKH